MESLAGIHHNDMADTWLLSARRSRWGMNRLELQGHGGMIMWLPFARGGWRYASVVITCRAGVDMD